MALFLWVYKESTWVFAKIHIFQFSTRPNEDEEAKHTPTLECCNDDSLHSLDVINEKIGEYIEIPQLDGFRDSSSFMEAGEELEVEEYLPIQNPVDSHCQSLQEIHTLIPQLYGLQDSDLEDYLV